MLLVAAAAAPAARPRFCARPRAWCSVRVRFAYISPGDGLVLWVRCLGMVFVGGLVCSY